MHEVAQGVWGRARERGERLFETWAGALCSLASASGSRLDEARTELQAVEGVCSALSDEALAEQIDVLGYLAQASSLLERSDDALKYARRGMRLAQSTSCPGMYGLCPVVWARRMPQRAYSRASSLRSSSDDACAR